nr:class I SAM-dependent methyltransferase [Syntrophobotulus glycolicus]
MAADTDSSLLGYIQLEKAKLGIGNIRTINIQDRNQLHQYQYDLVFLRDVFHHLQNPVAYFSELRSCLKTNGRIAIIDWNERASIFMRISGHYTPEQTILDTMTASGFICQANYHHLKGQSFNIFGFTHPNGNDAVFKALRAKETKETPNKSPCRTD